jgi:hypothetical protein
MGAGFLTEVVMTAAFLFVIMGATDERAPKGFAPIAIGLCLTLIHLISIPVTNTSVNPARSTGPALVVGGWALEQLWMFWVAPIIGGALGAAIYGFVAVRRPPLVGGGPALSCPEAVASCMTFDPGTLVSLPDSVVSASTFAPREDACRTVSSVQSGWRCCWGVAFRRTSSPPPRRTPQLQEAVPGRTDEDRNAPEEVSDLQTQNTHLTQSTTQRTQEKGELEAKSKQYEELAGSLNEQIKSGQIELSELKGKMTVKLKDRVVFGSGSRPSTSRA